MVIQTGGLLPGPQCVRQQARPAGVAAAIRVHPDGYGMRLCNFGQEGPQQRKPRQDNNIYQIQYQ